MKQSSVTVLVVPPMCGIVYGGGEVSPTLHCSMYVAPPSYDKAIPSSTFVVAVEVHGEKSALIWNCEYVPAGNAREPDVVPTG
jgi:hypothetical protein